MKIRVSNGMHQRNIELPLSDSELTRVMKSIGVTSVIPYCTLNTVWGDNDPLHLLERTQVNMDEVNFFAKRMESLTKYEQEVLSVYAERHGLNEMKELINLTFCMPGLSLIKDFSDAKQVGKQLYMDEHKGSYTEEFDERYRTIAQEINTLKEKQIEARRRKKLENDYEQRVKDMDAFIQNSTCRIPEFDNDLVRRLITNIKVISAEKLMVQFQSGIVLEQEIRYE